MKVYLACKENREEFLRGILEADFALETLASDGRTRPASGDAVVVDLSERSGDWRRYLEEIGGILGDGVRLLAVLRFEQMRALDSRVHLDDFIADGFTGEELRTRLRRMVGEEKAAAATVGELEIDEERYEVRMGGSHVELTFKEFELLRFLMSRPGKVFTREVLLEQVWGYDYFGGARTVDVHIRRIRSKIEREGQTYIRTVRGVGYIFEHTSRDV
ncbi:MAG: winged helix-turn-helix domain-containing protein [Actinobacteria bacterium]|nr:winged helix-turn-helix domain-containing protein [Actinomycetota bacterium]